MKKLAGLFCVVWFIAGCNTIHGIGQDIERSGEKVKQAATSVQQKL